jgi:hypothetical protein
MRKCDGLVIQERGTSVLDALNESGGLDVIKDPPRRFVHVVNPFPCAPNSENDQIQALTFATMAKAKAVYEFLQPSSKIEHVAAAFQEDASYAGRFFDVVETLTHSSLDVGAFNYPQKLPLLFEILGAAKRRAEGDDFIVFTNTDICLTVGFYDTIASLIRLGHDAIVVNRRTVEKFPIVPLIGSLASASLGRYHPGYDCFILRAKLLDSFVPTTSIVGRGGVMMALLFNLVAYAGRILILQDAHLTYHLGDDRSWYQKKYKDYIFHNFGECRVVFASVGAERQARIKAFEHPGGSS